MPQDEYISRIRAAHAARVRLQSDFVLIARTDALQSLGYDECIARLRAAREEGADVGLLEGFSSKEQAAQAVKDLAPVSNIGNHFLPFLFCLGSQDLLIELIWESFLTKNTSPSKLFLKEVITDSRCYSGLCC